MFGEAMEVKVGIALASGHFAIPGVFGAPWHRFCPSGVGVFFRFLVVAFRGHPLYLRPNPRRRQLPHIGNARPGPARCFDLIDLYLVPCCRILAGFILHEYTL